MSTVTFKHKAAYWMPGSFMSEEGTVELPERSVKAACTLMPRNAFAFRLIDVPVPGFEYDKNLFIVHGRPQNKSGKFYLDGQVYTADGLRALERVEGTNYKILIANMEGNGWPAVIRTRLGNWQPFETSDKIVNPADGREIEFVL